MGKTNTAKIPTGDFKVTTPENLLLSQQAVTNKGIPVLIPTYSWTLTPIPNWTCSVVRISPFDARLLVCDKLIARIPIHDFNHQLEKVVGCKVFQFIPTMKIKKMLSHKTLRYINTVTSSQEWWTRTNSVSSHNLLEQTLLNTCATCVHLTAHKIIRLYV